MGGQEEGQGMGIGAARFLGLFTVATKRKKGFKFLWSSKHM
jgi:hypothetical protein